jgi:DNA polymerase-3 subunit delta
MRALNAALERGIFDRAYLFHGDDEFLKEEKVRALIARATDSGTRDFNLDVRRGGETDAPALVLAFDALPLMAERRVVVLRDVTALKKDARAALDRYLDRPSADTVLVLTAVAGTKVEDRLIGRTVAIEFKPLNDDDLSKWVLRQVGNSGGSISAPAVELLCGATGNDLTLLAGEIDKLLNYMNGAEIDTIAVGEIVGVRKGETLGDLLDRVASRDAPGAIALLEHVLAQPKTTGVSIVMALTTQTLAIGWALAARDRGLPQHRLESELFGLLKENSSSMVGRAWGEGVKSWVRALRNWDDAAVDHALHHLLVADASLKDTRVSSDEQVLTSLILSLASTVRRHIAA